MKNKILVGIFTLILSHSFAVNAFEKLNSESLTAKYKSDPNGIATTAEELFFKGFVQQSNGNFQAALESYDLVLAIEPNDQDTLANRCGLLTELGQYQQAILDCQKAIALGGQISQAINFNLGIAQQSSGNFSAALESFQKLNAFAHQTSNQNLIQKAETRISLIQKALRGQIAKSSVNDYFNATNEALDGNLVPAENLYRRAVRVSPGFAEAYLELANIKAMQQDYEIAIENYKEAEKINPELLAIYNNRAAVWIKYKQDYGAAKKDLKKAKSIAQKNGQDDVVQYLEETIKTLE